MRITLFTSNQPRHLSLANKLSSISEEVFCVQECTTVHPGKVEDFYKKSDIMQNYFQRVMNSEKELFGDISFSPKNLRTLSIKSGDLNGIDSNVFKEALRSDIFVVFGASYIKGWLVDFLIEKKALNIHLGISPYYRGTACNFWALYDENFSHVGSTIHYLSKGLDNGRILFHALPLVKESTDPFYFTMKSVFAAHEALFFHLKNSNIFELDSFEQDKSKEVRYSRNRDFDDLVAKEFLDRNIVLPNKGFNYPELVQPFFI
tara:strand:- start:2249 stop:3031 length:783 start_codon:yes stop_codon:yes gene_type:complete